MEVNALVTIVVLFYILFGWLLCWACVPKLRKLNARPAVWFWAFVFALFLWPVLVVIGFIRAMDEMNDERE